MIYQVAILGIHFGYMWRGWKVIV